MKRLVYSPKINAYIKADSGIYDISEYIVDFTIDRKVNQVSTAELTIRNPYMKWTNHTYTDSITKEQKVGPIFHPMDPITIFLTRLQNRPVQVFTGFCDQTPYLQLFPGTVPIKASCTLKKLQYTYFDAGLPFMREFLEQAGWFPNENGSIVRPEAEGPAKTKERAEETNQGVRFGDSGIGELLFKVLNEIGGWPEETIFIQEMPSSVVNLVSNLFELFKREDEQASKELTALLHKIIGTSTSGGEGSLEIGPGGGEGPESGTPVTAIDVGRAMLTAGFPPDPIILAKGMTTVEHESAFGTASGWDKEHTGGVLGYWQIQRTSHPQYSNACKMNLLCSTKAVYEISEHGTNWEPWAASDFGSSEVPAYAWEPYLPKARKAIEIGRFQGTSNKQGELHR